MYPVDPAWKPGEFELSWTRNFVALLKDGALWGTTGGTYKFDKQKRQLIFINKSTEFDPEMHRRIVMTFKECGIEVVEKLNG